jgi:hypothetical protein
MKTASSTGLGLSDRTPNDSEEWNEVPALRVWLTTPLFFARAMLRGGFQMNNL